MDSSQRIPGDSMTHENRNDWLMRQFVDGVEARLMCDRGYSYGDAFLAMRERMVPYSVITHVLCRVSQQQVRIDEVTG